MPLIIPNKLCPQRFYTATLCFIGLMLNYCMRFALSICIVAMSPHLPSKVDPNACFKPHEEEHPDREYPFHWSSYERGIVMSSFFWGYFVTQIPGGMLADTFGAKTVIIIGVMGSSIISVFTPVVALVHWYLLILFRVLLGLFQGIVYASLHGIVAKWIPTNERAFWGAIVFTGSQFGMMVSTLVTGWLLHWTDGNWKLPFYLTGLCSFIWGVIFQFTTAGEPAGYPYLKPKEKEILDAYSISYNAKKAGTGPPPWKKILLSLPVWGFVVGMIGHDWGFFAVVTDVPKYMATALNFKVKENGNWMATGYLLTWLTSLSSGFLVDWLIKKNITSLGASRMIFTTLASGGQAFCLVGTAYTGCNRELALALLLISMSFIGFFYPSLKLNPIDLSPNYASTIGAVGHCIGTLSGIIVPYLIGALTPNNTVAEWRLVFWISFGVMWGTNIIYLLITKNSVQPWNSPESSPPPPQQP